MTVNHQVKVKGKKDDTTTKPLTKDVNEMSEEEIQSDSDLAIAILEEAISVFINGEPDVARLMLRNLVNATVGFETLATKTDKPSKSLHRMLSAKGNPTMDNLVAIVSVLREQLKVKEFYITTATPESAESADFSEQLKSA